MHTCSPAMLISYPCLGTSQPAAAQLLIHLGTICLLEPSWSCCDRDVPVACMPKQGRRWTWGLACQRKTRRRYDYISYSVHIVSVTAKRTHCDAVGLCDLSICHGKTRRICDAVGPGRCCCCCCCCSCPCLPPSPFTTSTNDDDDKDVEDSEDHQTQGNQC